MGSSTHGGYSNGKLGVTRLIRTVWKSVQERGCGKSGKILYFAAYLKDEFGMRSISLIPFLVTGLTSLLSMLLRSTFFKINCLIHVLWFLYLYALALSMCYKVFKSVMNPTIFNHSAMHSRMLRHVEKPLQRVKHWIIVILTFKFTATMTLFLVKMINNPISTLQNNFFFFWRMQEIGRYQIRYLVRKFIVILHGVLIML